MDDSGGGRFRTGCAGVNQCADAPIEFVAAGSAIRGEQSHRRRRGRCLTTLEQYPARCPPQEVACVFLTVGVTFFSARSPAVPLKRKKGTVLLRASYFGGLACGFGLPGFVELFALFQDEGLRFIEACEDFSSFYGVARSAAGDQVAGILLALAGARMDEIDAHDKGV